MTTAKSTIKRLATLSPMDTAERLFKAELEVERLRKALRYYAAFGNRPVKCGLTWAEISKPAREALGVESTEEP